MVVKSLADITGNGAAHPLVAATDLSQAKWVKFKADTGNSAVIRIGGSEVSSTRGFPLTHGDIVTFEAIAERTNFYTLADIYYYAGNSDKLYVEYSQG